MHDAPMHELIGFDGAVECRAGTGAINLSLLGFERHGTTAKIRSPAEALFASATPTAAATAHGLGALARRLHEVRIFELAAAPGTRLILLSSRELQLELTVRSLQLHRDAGREFFRAVPPPRVPLGRRLGWTLLLLVLRLPGAERLLLRLRGNR
jgi:hypothetical protein